MVLRRLSQLRWVACLVLGFVLLVSSFPTAPVHAAVNILDSRVFDWRFYLSNNADLLQANFTTRTQAETHWTNNGMREGRQGHPGFHTRQYLSLYADVRTAYGATNYLGAIDHYLTYGYPEGRRGYIEGGAYDRWTVRNDRIFVSASRRTAGAIDSIYWNGREFVNSYDHGRQVQVALNKNNLSECYNPTQAGRMNDSVGFPTTSNLEAVRASTNLLQTQVLPAFWLAPRQVSQFCATGAVNTTNVSNYRMNTAVQVGYAGLPHAIQFKSQIAVPESAAHLVTESPAVYVAGDFTSFYTYDPASQVLTPFSPAVNAQGELRLPVILATSNGAYAIGAWSSELPQVGFEQFAYAYAHFAAAGGNDVHATTKLRATFRASNVAPGTTLAYRTYLAVGSLNDVKNTLTQLHTKWRAGQL